MGYFSNGNEGMCYQAKYCDRCIHDDPAKGLYCPIWTMHLTYNYQECNKNDSFLHMLIPRDDENGTNKQCKLFVERK